MASRTAVEKLITCEGHEVTPGIASPLIGKDPRYFLVHGGHNVVPFAQKTQENEVGELLDGIHGVVDATRPEDVHELIHLLAKPG